MMGGYGMGGFGFGGVFMIMWWVLIIVGIVVLVKWLLGPSSSPGGGSGSGSGSRALDILKERYARGEIDEQEYRKKKQDLGQ